MRERSQRRAQWYLVTASTLCLAGMWLYAQRVLVAHQVAEAVAHGRPRGNLSDLYPRWLGARELLLHGRDPYSAGVTREIQAGYYGRPLDSARPEDPKDQQGFAYPAYVVFYLAPTVHLPFDVVRRDFFWVLLGLTSISIPIWLRILRWPLAPWTQASLVALTLGSLAVVQGLKLQQMTLLVVALVAVAIALLMTRHPVAAGILLALATIKPQVVCVLLFWLAIWTIGDWKGRYRLMVSFLITMAVLFVAAELLLPHWIVRFWHAANEYLLYTDGVPLLDELIPTPWSRLAGLAAAIGAALLCWRDRKPAEDTAEFAFITCLVLAVTLLIVPTHALYNQVLLVPALLLLARHWRAIWLRDRISRALLSAVAILVIWPWLSTIVLAALSFVMPPEIVLKAWAVPGWTALTLPVAVTGLMLLVVYRVSWTAPAGRAPA